MIRSILLAISLAIMAMSAAGQAPTQKLAGRIVAVRGDMLELNTGSGAPMTIRLGDKVRVSVRTRSDISRIEAGGFVGATAAPRADGTLVASEVHIFPESMRGTGEGHRPMDAGNTMTNATVSGVAVAAQARNTMTNATVSSVAGGERERTLTLSYKDGKKVIVVPVGTPIMTTETGDLSALVAGAPAVVYAVPQSDGGLVAERVSVGKDGFVPPL